MIELSMFFLLGFLAALLLTLVVVPFVHNRAERLTMRRLEASIPVSIAEVQASRDHLRADFAMSTRRLELTIEELRSKMMTYVTEVSKKNVVIARLQAEREGRAARREVPSSRDSGEKISAKVDWFRKAEDMLVDKDVEISKLRMELDDRSRTTDAQRIEIVALKIQIDALKRHTGDFEEDRVQARLGLPRRAMLRLAG